MKWIAGLIKAFLERLAHNELLRGKQSFWLEGSCANLPVDQRQSEVSILCLYWGTIYHFKRVEYLNSSPPGFRN